MSLASAQVRTFPLVEQQVRLLPERGSLRGGANALVVHLVPNPRAGFNVAVVVPAVHAPARVHQHGEEGVPLLTPRLWVRVRHRAADVERQRVLHELRQLPPTERHVLEPFQLHGEHQRRGVDRELLRRARHVRLTAAHLALVLVAPVEDLHGDVPFQRGLDALSLGDVQR